MLVGKSPNRQGETFVDVPMSKALNRNCPMVATDNGRPWPWPHSPRVSQEEKDMQKNTFPITTCVKYTLVHDKYKQKPNDYNKMLCKDLLDYFTWLEHCPLYLTQCTVCCRRSISYAAVSSVHPALVSVVIESYDCLKTSPGELSLCYTLNSYTTFSNTQCHLNLAWYCAGMWVCVHGTAEP
jgi:hypothetical protein